MDAALTGSPYVYGAPRRGRCGVQGQPGVEPTPVRNSAGLACGRREVCRHQLL